MATAQCRSRENSLEEAKTDILNRLNKFHSKSEYDKISQDRKNQMGTGERGDKIRTYRFQDNTVKDHQTNKQAQVSKVLNGFFDLLW